MNFNSSKKWVVLATGGTIAGLAPDASNPSQYLAAQVLAQDLVSQWGLQISGNVVFDQFAQVDSKDMSEDLWRGLLQRCQWWREQSDVSGIVITHGTDTLEETAFLLHWLLPPGVPVVVTGAMRASNHPQSDGPEHLQLAFDWLQSGHAHGVAVAFGGCIFHPEWVSKTHADRVAAFTCGDQPPLAKRQLHGWDLLKPSMEEALMTMWRKPSMTQACASLSWPRVDVFMHHAQADPWWLSQAVRSQIQGPSLAGVVVAATGHGTLNAAWIKTLEQLDAQGIRIAIASRCAFSTVKPDLAHAHWCYAGHLNAVKTRIALQMDCMA